MFRNVAKRREREAAEKALRQREQAIRQVVDEHKDDLVPTRTIAAREFRHIG